MEAGVPACDKRVLVTGGHGGIGTATVAALHADGWQPISPGSSELDLANRTSIEHYVATHGTDFDGLVLIAGINTPQTLPELEQAKWDEIMQVDLTANLALVQALVPAMAERGFGRVVAVSSGLALRTMPGRAAYSAAKAGLQSLVRSVAVEFGGRGVRANSVAPGVIMTQMQRTNMPEQVRNMMLPLIPAGRFGEAHDVAEVITFLMRPDVDYVNGVTIAVDGGSEAL